MKSLCLTMMALVLVSTRSWAGLDLAWNGCAGSSGDSTVVFDCRSESVATLVGTFQTSEPVARFVSLGISIDIVTETLDLDPYWHFEAGGCNRSGLTFSDIEPDSGCAGVGNPWGEEGADAFGGLAAYQPLFEGRNRGRMICIVARSAADPIALEANQNYFGFQLRIFSDNAKEAGGKCGGCPSPAVFRWNAASLSRVPAQAGDPALPDITLIGPGLSSNCVRANGASRATCAAIPAPRHSWDSLRGSGR